MFRVVFLVDDKKLGSALTALTGLAEQMELPQPVVNAEKLPNGSIVAKTSGGSLVDRITEALRSKHTNGSVITTQEIRKMLPALGGTTNSYSYALGHLRSRGILKPTRERGSYTLLTHMGKQPTAAKQLNGKKKHGGTDTMAEGKPLREHVAKWLKGKDVVTSSQIANFTVQLGLKRHSYTNALRDLQKDGVLKKSSTPHTYNVVAT